VEKGVPLVELLLVALYLAPSRSLSRRRRHTETLAPPLAVDGDAVSHPDQIEDCRELRLVVLYRPVESRIPARSPSSGIGSFVFVSVTGTARSSSQIPTPSNLPSPRRHRHRLRGELANPSDHFPLFLVARSFATVSVCIAVPPPPSPWFPAK
jgi:hypothetical protein